ncbi:hypothetical protein GLS40_00085 [Pseudooceanicola sp. 216_PA32_1]|uniref:DUF4189 domain-containing protein n=1 Tax=Pseudooceanicola pacificus TaxID=2676438 RepID=A0A844W9W2_9RHOB|nr:hypothetical protein [Pseudooceanicola pacificus]MWB76412.1 hypothetical protein [Pseudooceanicola pacificus]
MLHLKAYAAAAALLALAGTQALASTDFTCSFKGGKPGEETADGGLGPWQENGKDYAATDATERLAARTARLECTAAEELGAKGCMFVACVEGGAEASKASN